MSNVEDLANQVKDAIKPDNSHVRLALLVLRDNGIRLGDVVEKYNNLIKDEEYKIVTDNNDCNYIVPVRLLDEWYELVEEPDFEAPDWAEYLDEDESLNFTGYRKA